MNFNKTPSIAGTLLCYHFFQLRKRMFGLLDVIFVVAADKFLFLKVYLSVLNDRYRACFW